MGRWFPRLLIEWREPEAVRRWRDAQEMKALRGSFRPLLILLFAAMTLPAWFIQRELPGGAPRPLWIQAASILGVGIAVCYGYPWLSSRFASRVWVSEAAVSRSSGGRFAHVLRADILGHRLETRSFEGRDCRVLVLRHRSGKDVVLGVDSEVDVDRLQQVLMN